MKKKINRWIERVGLCLCLWACPVQAETLEDLERITSNYPSLHAFLEDRWAVMEYREALKLFLGADPSFHPTYQEFIDQIRKLEKEDPQFGLSAWKLDPQWATSSWTIGGVARASRLELKGSSHHAPLSKILAPSESRTEARSQDEQSLRALAEQLKEAYDLRPQSEIKAMSLREKKLYNLRLGGNAKEGLPQISRHPAAMKLARYAIYQILKSDEKLVDDLFSSQSDLVYEAAQKVLKLETQTPALAPIADVAPYLRFHDEGFRRIVREYEEGIEAMQRFGQVPTPRLAPPVLARVLELQAQGVDEDEIGFRLSLTQSRVWQEWREARTASNAQKKAIFEAFVSKSRYFTFPFSTDPQKGTLRLKNVQGIKATFVPPPRPFHAFFTGVKYKVCVGGRNAEDLTPKYWALPALSGAHTLLSISDSGQLEGSVIFTELVHHDKPEKKYYTVNLLSHALTGEVILESGETASLFDLFVKAYHARYPLRPLVISDGSNVKSNASSYEVVQQSLAYRENQVVGMPREWKPSDPLADKISSLFPETFNQYGMGGMIYEGMRGDGSKIVELTSPAKSRKWSREELEAEIAKQLLMGHKIKDTDFVKKKADQSEVQLAPWSYYLDKIKEKKGALRRLGIKQLQQEWRESQKLWERKLALEQIKNVIVATTLTEEEKQREFFTPEMIRGVLHAIENEEGEDTAYFASWFLWEALHRGFPVSALDSHAIEVLTQALDTKTQHAEVRWLALIVKKLLENHDPHEGLSSNQLAQNLVRHATGARGTNKGRSCLLAIKEGVTRPSPPRAYFTAEFLDLLVDGILSVGENPDPMLSAEILVLGMKSFGLDPVFLQALKKLLLLSGRSEGQQVARSTLKLAFHYFPHSRELVEWSVETILDLYDKSTRQLLAKELKDCLVHHADHPAIQKLIFELCGHEDEEIKVIGIQVIAECFERRKQGEATSWLDSPQLLDVVEEAFHNPINSQFVRLGSDIYRAALDRFGPRPYFLSENFVKLVKESLIYFQKVDSMAYVLWAFKSALFHYRGNPLFAGQESVSILQSYSLEVRSESTGFLVEDANEIFAKDFPQDIWLYASDAFIEYLQKKTYFKSLLQFMKSPSRWTRQILATRQLPILEPLREDELKTQVKAPVSAAPLMEAQEELLPPTPEPDPLLQLEAQVSNWKASRLSICRAMLEEMAMKVFFRRK